jgi:ABC-type phosphate transport system substrate-binding protein
VLVLFLVNFLTSEGVTRELVVIAHRDVEENSLDYQTLQRIYHGKKKQWSNKKNIVPVMLKSGPIHELFIEEVLKEIVHKFVTYWKQMLFTGRGIPPKSFIDEIIYRRKGIVAFCS